LRKYIGQRLLFMIPTMLVLTCFAFASTHISPSDAITLKLERRGALPDKAQVEQMKENLRLETAADIAGCPLPGLNGAA